MSEIHMAARGLGARLAPRPPSSRRSLAMVTGTGSGTVDLADGTTDIPCPVGVTPGVGAMVEIEDRDGLRRVTGIVVAA